MSLSIAYKSVKEEQVICPALLFTY